MTYPNTFPNNFFVISRPETLTVTHCISLGSFTVLFYIEGDPQRILFWEYKHKMEKSSRSDSHACVHAWHRDRSKERCIIATTLVSRRLVMALVTHSPGKLSGLFLYRDSPATFASLSLEWGRATGCPSSSPGKYLGFCFLLIFWFGLETVCQNSRYCKARVWCMSDCRRVIAMQGEVAQQQKIKIQTPALPWWHLAMDFWGIPNRRNDGLELRQHCIKIDAKDRMHCILPRKNIRTITYAQKTLSYASSLTFSRITYRHNKVRPSKISINFHDLFVRPPILCSRPLGRSSGSEGNFIRKLLIVLSDSCLLFVAVGICALLLFGWLRFKSNDAGRWWFLFVSAVPSRLAGIALDTFPEIFKFLAIFISVKFTKL